MVDELDDDDADAIDPLPARGRRGDPRNRARAYALAAARKRLAYLAGVQAHRDGDAPRACQGCGVVLTPDDVWLSRFGLLCRPCFDGLDRERR